jgi:hypothetical protein
MSIARGCAGDRIHLVTVVNNDRSLPVSVGMGSPTGPEMSVSFDDDFGYERTRVCSLPAQVVTSP